MAASLPSLGESNLEESDKLLDEDCEPCYVVPASCKVKQVTGYCNICDENLCKECGTSNRGLKLFKNQSASPNLQLTTMNGFNNKVREYMPTVAIVIVAIILTLFLNFHTEKMNKLDKNIEDCKDIRNFKEVANDVKKLRDEFVDLMTKTEKQADLDKRDDCTKIENIVMEQINKLTVQIETLNENNENESLFRAIKLAQGQIQSLEEKLDKLDKYNTVSKLKATQKVKIPTHVKDIAVTLSIDQSFTLYGSLLLPYKQILITDFENKKLKLIDTNQDKIISQVQLSGDPYDFTKIRDDEVAVSVNGSPPQIQFISVSKNSMSRVREFKCDGSCKGIDYNDRDHTLIVTFVFPPKVKILDMNGKEIKCFEYDFMGARLFNAPYYVALTPDMTRIYVTDFDKHSVTLLSLNGVVETVYKNNIDWVDGPEGLYVHTSGLVYVVGGGSYTIHVLDPESGEFKVVLDEKDGLDEPRSISYCETEDKMYIGMMQSSVMKVFQMN